MLDTLSDDDYVNVARVRRRLQVNDFQLTVQITPESNKTQIPVVFIKHVVIEQEVTKWHSVLTLLPAVRWLWKHFPHLLFPASSMSSTWDCARRLLSLAF